MDSEERQRFSGKVYSRRNRKINKKHFSPATAAKFLFFSGLEMDSEERQRFSGKVYSRRNRKITNKHFSPATAACVTAPGTNVSQSEKVVAQTHENSIVNSTSGYVPDGGVKIGEGSSSGAVVVKGGDTSREISLNKAKSKVEIKNLKRKLEGEVDQVRCLVNRIEANEKPKPTSLNNNRSLVLVPSRGNVYCMYPRFIFTNDRINPLPLVHPNLPNPFRPPPSLPPIPNYNPAISSGFVERTNKIPKVKDKLPSEPRKTKPSILPQVGRTPIPKKPKAKDPKKRDMTAEETQKLSRDLENLPPEQLDAFTKIVKKRGIPLKQNNEELELDIDNVDTETLWELERFVTSYNKRKPKVARNAPITSSSPMVADAAMKESRTGETRTSASSSHVKGANNASSCSSDSGSSSSDSDSDSSSDESMT